MDHTETIFAVIIDVDWAPDFIINEIAALLNELNIRATWFLTHPSPAVECISGIADFEMGIHPNFLKDSSQGKSWEEVIDYCLKINPKAVSMRTHNHYGSNSLFDYINRTTDIENDASIFMPLARDLHPVRYWIGDRYINRFAVFWEDNNELGKPKPDLNFETEMVNSAGLKIFAFHPILLALNSATIQPYNILKNTFRNFEELSQDNLAPYLNHQKPGVRDFLEKLSKYVNHTSHFHLIKELSNLYDEAETSDS